MWLDSTQRVRAPQQYAKQSVCELPCCGSSKPARKREAPANHGVRLLSSPCSPAEHDVSLDQTSAEHIPLTTTSIDQRLRHLNQCSQSTGSGLRATFLSGLALRGSWLFLPRQYVLKH